MPKGLLLGHNLEIECPSWKIPSSYCIVKVASVTLAVLCNYSSRLAVRKIFYTLLCAEVKFHPHSFPVAVYKAVCVRAESVHIAVRRGYPPIGHYYRYLMQSLG